MSESQLISNTINFVKSSLKDAEGGHDWFHVLRVWNNAKMISKNEKVDLLVVQLGALLHDIADSKFYGGDETIGPKLAEEFLKDQKVAPEIVRHIIAIIKSISFKSTLSSEEGKSSKKFQSPELDIIQDADRLDAIGAIGIARCFNYGGFKNRPIYDPNIPANLNISKEAYKNSNAPSINHFYEKLLLLKDRMNTKKGREIALERHQFMEHYLEMFYKDWGYGIQKDPN
jgi:uncharacterized protein